MLKKLIAGLLATLSVCAQSQQHVKTSELIDLGSAISNGDAVVEGRLKLYINNPQAYFRKYEEMLWERGIENATELEPVIALVDSLKESKSVVYTDHATPADQVLLMFDKHVGGKLEKQDCFKNLQEAYVASEKHNAIGNFLYNNKFGPMPVDCVRQAGFSLLAIDEGSDSYVFILVSLDKLEELKGTADRANIGLNQF